MGQCLVRVWAGRLFFLILTSSFLPFVASLFTAELCAIFFALIRISFHVIYSESRSALQALGNLYSCYILILKIQLFLCDPHADRKYVSFRLNPSHVGLSGNEKVDVLVKWAVQLPPANHYALPFQDYASCFHCSIHASWQFRWGQCDEDDNALAQLKPFLGLWSSCSQPYRRFEVSLTCLRIGNTHLTVI